MNFNNQSLNKMQVLQSKGGAKQQGFVLILSLVMLTMLTLIGVSSMNSANIELKATANAQHHQVAFDAVMSMLEYTRSAPANAKGGGGDAYTIDYTTTDETQIQTVTRDAADDLKGTSNLSADVVYLGCAKASEGSSLENGFAYSYYVVAGTGANTSGTSTSLQTQGVRFVAADCVPLTS